MRRKRNTIPGEKIVDLPLLEPRSDFIKTRLSNSRYNRRNLIFRMASVGCTPVDMAYVLDVPKKEVEAFGGIIDKGRAAMRIALRHKQFQMAMRGSVPMQIFLGKNILGQREDPGSPEEAKGALQDLIKALRAGPTNKAAEEESITSE